MNTQEPHPKERPTEDAYKHGLSEGQRQCPKCGGKLILMRWIAHPKHKPDWVCTGKDHYTPAGRAALPHDTDTDAGGE